MDRSWLNLTVGLIAGCLLSGLILAAPVLNAGPRSITAVENIHGVRFPLTQEGYAISEQLAHVDIELQEPTLAKKLTLTMELNPKHTQELYVGVRENSFWLSYPWQLVTVNPAPNVPFTKTITIPLTDKLADKNRSIDVMFLAGSPSSLHRPDQAETDTAHWQLISLTAHVSPDVPAWLELKNYLRSLIQRERPL